MTPLLLFVGFLVVVNMAWCVIGSIMDDRKCDKENVYSRIETNLSVSTRNIKAAIINVLIALVIVGWKVIASLK